MTPFVPRLILPPLSPDEQQHSAAVAVALREAIIKAGGWLSFERFMDLALYTPGLGYYSAGSAKIGASGDFVTAPEISDLFSRCLARQCAEVLSTVGGQILELGAGTGRMAATVLESLAIEGVLPDRYCILEVSADLAERQRERMQSLPAGLRERVVWLERLPEQPMRGVVLANEILDALPFRRFVVDAVAPGGSLSRASASASGAVPGELAVLELGVTLDGDRFVERPCAPDDALACAFEALLRELPEPLPYGYISEMCPRLESWVASIGERFERGLMLMFDYGLPRSHYYHPQRVSGTLRCHFKHLAHDDPYINVGVQDITAWVDFTRLAEAAVAAGLDVAGFCTQAGFLLSTGIEGFVAEPSDSMERIRRAGEARRLLVPGEMGEAFKVMGLVRDYDVLPCGFALQDLRHSL